MYFTTVMAAAIGFILNKTRLGAWKSQIVKTNRANDLEGTGDGALEEAKMRQRRQNIDLGRVLAKQFDGADAVRIETVVNVLREVVADRGGRDGDARRPFFDELVDVIEAVIA